MSYSAKILRDSVTPDGVRLTTFEVSFPRIVLAEFNTHRTLSRNSASSRAIPVKTMLERVKNDPFLPVFWGKNQKGMQAEEALSPEAQVLAQAEWLRARDNAVNSVEYLQLPDVDMHKQIANRLLEPWLYHTVICTATEWDNFWGLRANKAAQPEIRKIAEMMKELYVNNTPKPINYGDWHLPLMEDAEQFDLLAGGMSLADVVKVSVGRCARVSYLTHDGKRDPKADIELATRLMTSGHMSPFEHAARPMTQDDVEIDLRKTGYALYDKLDLEPAQKFNGNFRGWVQARKHIAYEDNFLLVQGSDRSFEVDGYGK